MDIALHEQNTPWTKCESIVNGKKTPRVRKLHLKRYIIYYNNLNYFTLLLPFSVGSILSGIPLMNPGPPLNFRKIKDHRF